MNSHVPIAYLRQLPNFAVLFHLQKLSPVFVLEYLKEIEEIISFKPVCNSFQQELCIILYYLILSSY